MAFLTDFCRLFSLDICLMVYLRFAVETKRSPSSRVGAGGNMRQLKLGRREEL